MSGAERRPGATVARSLRRHFVGCAALAAALVAAPGALIPGCGGAEAPAPYEAPGGVATDLGDPLPPSQPISGGPIHFQPDFAPLAACADAPTALALPAQPTASGALQLWPSGHAAPIGAIEVVDVIARRADGSVDPTAAGSMAVSVGAGLELVAATPMVAGEAALRLRLTGPGPATLAVALADGRSASVQLRGYRSRLPRLELALGDAAQKALLADPEADVWVEAELRERLVVDAAAGTLEVGEVHPVRVRLHGGSSRQFHKKSLRIDLQGGHRLRDGRRRAVLRAEFVDKSLLRSWLALDLLAGTTALPVSRARHVHLRVDDRYWGVMLDVERVDGDLLERAGLQRHGSLYEADPPLEFAVPGGNLTPLADLQRYQLTYPQQSGPFAWEDLRRTIEDVLQRPDAAFVADLDRYVDVDAVLVYWAAMTVMQNQDMVRKNYYLYRAVSGDDTRWRLLPWDLDLTFGHLWTEVDDVLAEEIFVDGSLDVGRNAGHPYYNHLIDRMMAHQAMRARYLGLVAQLSEVALAEGVLAARVEAAACAIAGDALADRRKRADNSEWAARVQELVDFVPARRAYLQQALLEAK